MTTAHRDDEKTAPDSAPALSIIVPYRAVHKRLAACLASVRAHVSLKYELLLIDDGNKGADFSGIVCDPAVLVISMAENCGPGACRNVGLNVARGTWTLFLDSDDTLTGDPAAYLQAARQAIPGQVADIITGTLQGKTPGAATQGKPPYVTNITDDPSLIKLAAFTAHLYRTAFLQEAGSRFAENTRTGEDTVFLAHALARATTVVRSHTAIYDYHTRPGSLSRTDVTWDAFRARFGIAAPQVLDALEPYRAARQARGAMLFKFAVLQMKRNAAVFKGHETEAIAIVAALARGADALTESAANARLAAKVYWDEKFDRCARMLIIGQQDAFLRFIAEEDMQAFRTWQPK